MIRWAYSVAWSRPGDDAGLEVADHLGAGLQVADRVLDGHQAAAEPDPEGGYLVDGRPGQGQQHGPAIIGNPGGGGPGGDLGRGQHRFAAFGPGDGGLAEPGRPGQFPARQPGQRADPAQLGREPVALGAGLTGQRAGYPASAFSRAR